MEEKNGLYALPISFVSILMVIALLGNLLVIIVFKCRWRTTGATQVYILVLAALDLVCTTVSMPRDLVTLIAMYDNSSRENGNENCFIDGTNSTNINREFCRGTVFLTFQLNFTTALILVFIATCRFVRVMNGGHGFRFQGRVKVKSAKFMVMKILNGIGTVRGAKIASVVSFCVALVISCPTLAYYPNDPCDSTCFQSCLGTRPKAPPLRALLSFYFFVFLASAMAMVVLYGLILQRLWKDRKEEITEMRTRPKSSAFVTRSCRQSSVFVPHSCRQSSVFVSRRSGSLGTLCEAVHKAVLDSKRQVVRTMSEGDAVATNPEGNTAEGAQPEIYSRSASSPYTNRDKERIMQGITGGHPRPRCESDPSRGEGVESKQQTIFPPVSYTAQLRSMLSLNIVKKLEEEQVSVRSRHASDSSFQFSKYGNRARKTTIVFVLITAIFILSYLPFFILEMSDVENSATVEFFSKFYLISNAANPLVYGFCNPHFRNTLWKLLVCRREII
ncbi:uncharacterized protein [Littorina saxatilis]|uniref:G-protein coupled receptors family 1 profile domain-containing protein n=1 Tax=Littorina saxatilis TaxID=31220 RepID=A0AAN9ASA0_9CAEN